MEDIAKGRELWEAYRVICGDDFRPSSAGLKKLSIHLGISQEELGACITKYLSARRTYRAKN